MSRVALSRRDETMDEITRILEAVEAGDTDAAEKLLPLAYQELRRLASHQMANEAVGHTLQPTALVHEAYLRLLGPDGEPQKWNSRAHLFTAAARAMRRILIERARRKQTAKRGSGAEHTAFEESKLDFVVPIDRILEVEAALQKLETEDPDLAQVVLLRFYAGMTVPETAAALGVSASTIDRQWRCAKAWLYHEISGEN